MSKTWAAGIRPLRRNKASPPSACFSIWLATGGCLPFNPATAVRGPKHFARSGKTPVLDQAEARQLIDSIDVSTPIGLRDRVLIGLLVYKFARIGAVVGMKVEDVFTQNRRLWVRLHEKGGKPHEMPCNHNLDAYLHAYVDGCGVGDDLKGLLFRTIGRRGGGSSSSAIATGPRGTKASISNPSRMRPPARVHHAARLRIR